MKKETYSSPTMQVVKMPLQQQLLDYSVITPGAPNTPPGTRSIDFLGGDGELTFTGE